MTHTEGKVFRRVEELLRDLGRLDLRGLQVATLTRGTYHLVILNGETIGEYNHISDELSLYI
jgi:hypothetical protein